MSHKLMIRYMEYKHKIIKLKIRYPVCMHLYNEYMISTIVKL